MSAPEQLGFDEVGEAPIDTDCAWCGHHEKVFESELADEYLEDDEMEWYCSADCLNAAVEWVHAYCGQRDEERG
jgi:hypothetical protein